MSNFEVSPITGFRGAVYSQDPDPEDESSLGKTSYDDSLMFLEAIRVQMAKDNQVMSQTEKNSAAIDAINERVNFVASLVQDLLHERNKGAKEVSLEHLAGKMQRLKDEFLRDVTVADPLSNLYPGPLQKVKMQDLEEAISGLQELMRQDSNELQKLGRNTEYLMQLYVIITEMLAKQKPDETKTFVRNQTTGIR